MFWHSLRTLLLGRLGRLFERWSETAQRQPAAPDASIPDQPPNAWRERTALSPPDHWLERVRRNAPQLLEPEGFGLVDPPPGERATQADISANQDEPLSRQAHQPDALPVLTRPQPPISAPVIFTRRSAGSQPPSTFTLARPQTQQQPAPDQPPAPAAPAHKSVRIVAVRRVSPPPTMTARPALRTGSPERPTNPAPARTSVTGQRGTMPTRILNPPRPSVIRAARTSVPAALARFAALWRAIAERSPATAPKSTVPAPTLSPDAPEETTAPLPHRSHPGGSAAQRHSLVITRRHPAAQPIPVITTSPGPPAAPLMNSPVDTAANRHQAASAPIRWRHTVPYPPTESPAAPQDLWPPLPESAATPSGGEQRRWLDQERRQRLDQEQKGNW